MRNQGLIRLIRVMQLLQQQPRTFRECAALLGVTCRTVRRDVEALEALGVPVSNERETGTHGRYVIAGAARCPLCRRGVRAC